MTEDDTGDSGITVITNPARARAYLALLQEGVALTAKIGVTVRSFLCEGLKVDRDYLSGRVSTIFHNGKPVDYIDRALIGDGDRLSLSGALPGLAGAVMRRSSTFATLRSAVPERSFPASRTGREGTVWLRLFNVVLEDLGPLILQQGVLVRPEQLTRLFCPQGEGPLDAKAKVLLNSVAPEPETLGRLLSSEKGLVSFTLSTSPDIA